MYNTLSAAFTLSNLRHFLLLQKGIITFSFETAVEKAYVGNVLVPRLPDFFELKSQIRRTNIAQNRLSHFFP